MNVTLQNYAATMTKGWIYQQVHTGMQFAQIVIQRGTETLMQPEPYF